MPTSFKHKYNPNVKKDGFYLNFLNDIVVKIKECYLLTISRK